jgi:hypothetical protein
MCDTRVGSGSSRVSCMGMRLLQAPKNQVELYYGHLLPARMVRAWGGMRVSVYGEEQTADRVASERAQVMLTGRIDDNTVNSVVGQLLYLQTESPSEPITLVINSFGGQVSAGLALYDIMQIVTVRHASPQQTPSLSSWPGSFHSTAFPHTHSTRCRCRCRCRAHGVPMACAAW